jgi:hypothetical protein
VENYISEQAGKDLSKVFDQYLRDVRIPVLEYSFKDGNLMYRWSNAVRGFDMPIKIWIDGESTMLEPLTNWKSMSSEGTALKVDVNYYVGSMNTLGK